MIYIVRELMPNSVVEIRDQHNDSLGRWNMISRLTSIATSILVAVAILFAFGSANADEPTEGFEATVIAEYSSRVPPLEKVRYVKVVFQPGGKMDNIEIVHEEYCRLSQGQLTHINHTNKITDVFTVGALWSPPKGDRHTVTNTGDGVAIMVIAHPGGATLA